MKNKNLIRFVESFVLLPVMATMPVAGIQGNLIKSPESFSTTSQIVLSKMNIEASGLFALNLGTEDKAEDEATAKARVLQAKADAIDAFFKSRKAPLAGYGMKMVLEAEEHGLDWRLLPSIATVESNGGKQACKGATHSYFGWGSCKINFKSVEHGIEVVARNLGGDNPKTARYYQKGMDLDRLLKTYNPPHIVENYSERVMKVMEMIGTEDIAEKINETKTEA